MSIVDAPVALDGLFSDVISWAKHKGNRPGTKASRAGIVSADDVQRELDKLKGSSPTPAVASIGGVPMDQVIMLSGFALAALLMLSGGKRRR